MNRNYVLICALGVTATLVNAALALGQSITHVATWNPAEQHQVGDGAWVGLVVGGDGSLYAADMQNGRILRYSASGEVLGLLGSRGSGPGQFSWGGQPTITDSGNLLTEDSYRLQEITPEGAVVRIVGEELTGQDQLQLPSGATMLKDGSILVCDTNNNRLAHFSSTGQLLGFWGHKGTGNLEFESPTGVVCTEDGYIFVADFGNNRIQKLDASGAFITLWGTGGSGLGAFASPAQIATDAAHRLFVTDMGNNRVQVFNESGAFLFSFGGDGTLDQPTGIAISASGTIYVASTGSGLIQAYSLAVPVRATTWSEIKAGYR